MTNEFRIGNQTLESTRVYTPRLFTNWGRHTHEKEILQIIRMAEAKQKAYNHYIVPMIT